MTLEEFRATARPVSDETWIAAASYVDAVTIGVGRERFIEYDEGYLIHEADGKFWVHAWWHEPRPWDDKAEAEAELFKWRAEFN